MVAVDDAQRLTLTELQFFGDLADAERAAGRRLMVLLVGRPALDVKLARLESDRPDAPAALRARLSRSTPRMWARTWRGGSSTWGGDSTSCSRPTRSTASPRTRGAFRE